MADGENSPRVRGYYGLADGRAGVSIVKQSIFDTPHK
jgi:hypothetical protein